MKIQDIKRFGEREIKLLLALEQKKGFIFTFGDAKKILGTSEASAKNVLKRLKKKRRIIPLQKGTYLFAPLRSGREGLWSAHAFAAVPFLVKTSGYYVGFVSAMNYWGMTEQIPYTVNVALRRQKKKLRALQAEFVFVKKKALGDFVQDEIEGVKINISSKEQTLLDGLAFPEYCLGVAGVAKAIHYSKKEINWEKLALLAKNGKSSVQRRLGFLLELLGLKKQSKMLEGDFHGFVWLEPSAQKKDFAYSKKWGLKLNVKNDDVLEFMRGY